jgi:hypothetical protein
MEQLLNYKNMFVHQLVATHIQDLYTCFVVSEKETFMKEFEANPQTVNEQFEITLNYIMQFMQHYFGITEIKNSFWRANSDEKFED